MFMVTVYYSEKILKSTKGRDTRERVQERPGGNSHLSPPGEAVGTVLPPSVMWGHCQPGELP